MSSRAVLDPARPPNGGERNSVAIASEKALFKNMEILLFVFRQPFEVRFNQVPVFLHDAFAARAGQFQFGVFRGRQLLETGGHGFSLFGSRLRLAVAAPAAAAERIAPAGGIRPEHGELRLASAQSGTAGQPSAKTAAHPRRGARLETSGQLLERIAQT